MEEFELILKYLICSLPKSCIFLIVIFFRIRLG